MEHNLNIILVEDETDACKRFTDYVDTIDNVSIIEITNNSYQALELVAKLHPDAVILDLELHLGQGNGLLFLQGLKDLDVPFKPYILITTNNSSTLTYNHARQLGADFIMSKHQEDYSEENVIQLLIMMKDTIQKSIIKQNTSLTTSEAPAQFEKRTKKRIAIELDRVGISPKLIGYQYLIEAIYLVANGQSHNIGISVGQKYSKTCSSVERAMQNAINKAWRTTEINDLVKNYTAKIRIEKGVPTLTEFIFYYGNKIKNGF